VGGVGIGGSPKEEKRRVQGKHGHAPKLRKEKGRLEIRKDNERRTGKDTQAFSLKLLAVGGMSEILIWAIGN